MKNVYAALLLSLLATACKHPLDVIGQGDILSSTGDRDCYYEWTDPDHPMHFECADNEVNDPNSYIVTYYAQARPGWSFHRWGEPFCKDEPTNECSWNFNSSLVAAAGASVLPPQLAIFREDVISGYKSVFMGHSLFTPFADGMVNQAAQANFVNHSQEVFFYAASQGAPINVWNNPTSKAQVQAKLDEGDVDLFGMAIHHDPSTQGIEGYRLWVDYALQQNQDTRFFIGIPWLWYPHIYGDPASVGAPIYDSAWHAYHPGLVHPLIDQLRAEFPYTDFFCIPYGQAAGELYKLYGNNNLPDVVSAVTDPNNPGPAIWYDYQPHADDILVDLGELVWLNAIYGVDMTTYTYDPGYITDLKAIADAISAAHDPNYNAPYLAP